MNVLCCVEVMVDLACHTEGSVVMRLCVLVGTQPFTRLNGSYTTYTIHLTRECQGTVSINPKFSSIVSAVL